MSSKEPKHVTRRAAILGAGYISKFHIEALRSVPGLELAAVCDLSHDKALSVARGFGIEGIYTGLDAILSAERLDAVHVLLPPQHHFRAVMQLLDAGVNVFAEKPLGATSDECREMAVHAEAKGLRLGVSHNFLFSPAYEAFLLDLRGGRFGRLDQVDIVWNKELGQVKAGPFGGWLFARPQNVLLEVGPHSFAHLAHLVGEVDALEVMPQDRIELPGGREFFRRYEVMGVKGRTSVRLRFAFIDGFTQHYIQVRGERGAALIDIEHNTYTVQEHGSQMIDLDRYANSATASLRNFAQANDTLGRFLLSKLGLVKGGPPFQRSISSAVQAFYAGLDGELDPRLAPGLATQAVGLAERVGERMTARAKLEADEAARAAKDAPPSAAQTKKLPPAEKTSVLVLGGTGFIGQALVRKLREAGQGVRLVARDPRSVSKELLELGLDVVRGDLGDTASLEAALPGIEQVYHLARGYGESWEDYLANDVEPTRRFAEACVQHGVKRLYYTSSISIYHAGRSAGTITEQTPPHPGVLRTNLYSRAKVEIEKILLELHGEKGLGVVIFRPGVVLGRGGNPLHWGIAAWPFSSVPRLYGDGSGMLPIVLVDDCADAMVNALDTPSIEGQSFNLVGEQLLTAQEYLDELERHAGVNFKRIPTSPHRYFVEDIGKYLIKTVGRDKARKRPSFANWDGRTFEARFDASRARQLLRWAPTTDRETIIREGIVRPAEQFLR